MAEMLVKPLYLKHALITAFCLYVGIASSDREEEKKEVIPSLVRHQLVITMMLLSGKVNSSVRHSACTLFCFTPQQKVRGGEFFTKEEVFAEQELKVIPTGFSQPKLLLRCKSTGVPPNRKNHLSSTY